MRKKYPNIEHKTSIFLLDFYQNQYSNSYEYTYNIFSGSRCDYNRLVFESKPHIGRNCNHLHGPLPSLCSNILPEKPHKSVVNSYTWEKVPKREHIIKVSYIYSDIFIICQISLSSPPIECTIGFFSDSLKVCCQIVCALLVRMKHPGGSIL